jgi:hypothetical protein
MSHPKIAHGPWRIERRIGGNADSEKGELIAKLPPFIGLEVSGVIPPLNFLLRV